MKRTFLNILIFGIVATVFLSCERETESEEAYGSVFYLTPPSFNSPDGAKTYWTDDGLWWNPDTSDYINVNGNTNNLGIVRDGNQWKTVKLSIVDTAAAIQSINDSFYVCYVGGSGATAPTFSNGVFSGVNLSSGIIPMVGVSKTPNVTLKPCCALLKITNLDDGVPEGATNFRFTVAFQNLDTKFVKVSTGCSLNAVTACVSGTTTTNSFTVNELTNTAYIVLPMSVDQCMAKPGTGNNNNYAILFSRQYKVNGSVPGIMKTTKLNTSISIHKGYVYEIDWRRIQ